MLFKVHYRYVIIDVFKKAMVSSCHDPTEGMYLDGKRKKVVLSLAQSSALQEPNEMTTGCG